MLADEIRAAVVTAVLRSEVSQSWLAGEVGVSEKHLSQVMTGKAKPSYDLADRIMTALGRTWRVTTRSARSG